MTGRALWLLSITTGCATPVGHRLAACVVHEDGTPVERDASGALDVSFEGEVVAIGASEDPAVGCYDLGFGARVNTAHSDWFTVDTGTEAFTVGVAIRDTGPPVAAGDRVAVAFSHETPPGDHEVGRLVLRIDGEVVLWMAEAGGLGEARPPRGFALADAGTTATRFDACGSWSLHDLRVRVPGGSIDLPYGAVVTDGDYTAIHGGFDRRESGCGQDDLSVAVQRADPASGRP